MAGTFGGKVLVLGGGSVAQCTVPLLIKDLVVDPSQIIVMDFHNKALQFTQEVKDAGVKFVTDRVTQNNYAALISQHLRAGDLFIDLAWNVDAADVIDYCHKSGILYINTATELWDPYAVPEHPIYATLMSRHKKLEALRASWDTKGPTAVVEHGANPGLVSHFVKRALTNLANMSISEDGVLRRDEILHTALHEKQWNKVAQRLGVKVIHIAERDTQVTDRPKLEDEFVNTWSVEGFYEEGLAPAELGWGTHEKTLPLNSYAHPDSQTQILIAHPGADTWVRSWVPGGPTNGMLVRHGEAYTITKHLTVVEDGVEVYRPTVHYAYMPSDAAIASMRELIARDWNRQSRERIMNDEILPGGQDRLGVLLMGHRYNAYWYGSLLSIDEARTLVPGQSATTLQVAASVSACARWMVDNPSEGLCVPDDLPHETVLQYAEPYLGKLHAEFVDWTPLKHLHNPYKKYDGSQETLDHEDPWQFHNFLIS